MGYFYERHGEWLPVPTPVPLYRLIRDALLNALAFTDGCQKRAAKALGISPRQLNYALVTYDIPTDHAAPRSTRQPTVRVINVPGPKVARPVAPKPLPKPPTMHGVISTRRRYHVRWVGVIEATSPREAARAARGVAFYRQAAFDVREFSAPATTPWEEINLDEAPARRAV